MSFIDTLNVRQKWDFWYELNWDEWDEKKFFAKYDCYEEYSPPDVFRNLKTENLVVARKTKLFHKQRIFYTREEIQNGQVIVTRNFGRGNRKYYFDVIYIKINWGNREERKWYSVACEIIEPDDFLRYVKFCRCQHCRNKEKYNAIERFFIRINPVFPDYDEPCLKHGECTNNLLKDTRRYVNNYCREFLLGDPTDFLTKKELKKYSAFLL